MPDLARAMVSWGWLLGELGYSQYQDWPQGRSWRLGNGGPYIVVEQTDAATSDRHERLRPGMNHLALWASSRSALDALVERSPDYGWTLIFADRHPFAGGAEHYAAYLEDRDGYEVELVAD